MAVRASSVDVRLRLRGQRQFKKEVSTSAAELEALGLKGAKALGAFARQSDKLKSFGASWTRNVSLPIVGVGVAATKMFMDFDDSMNKMVGLVGIGRAQVQGWHEDVLDLSQVTGQAPTELADALFFITSAGLRGGAAIDALTASAKAADAGLGETKAIADAVTSAMNAYGPANLKASRATDILTAAVREGKMEASELAPVIGKALPLAQAMGVSFDEVAGSMALFAKSGIDAAAGATQVTAILGTFSKPTTEMEEAFDKMGLSIGQVRRMIAKKGLLDTLDMLRTRTKRYGVDLSQVFGNKRAITGVLQLTKNLRDSRDVLGGVAHSAGLTNRAFNEAQKTAGDKLGDALNSLRVMAIRLGATLGQTVAPMLEDLGNTIGDLGDKFSRLSPETRKNIVLFAGIAVALGPAISVLGYFAGGVGRVLITTAKLVRTGKAIYAFSKGFMALRAGVGTLEALKVAMAGFGLTLRGVMLTTGIGVAIAAIVLLNEKFHFLGPTLSWLKGAMADAFGWMKENVGPVIAGIVSALGDVVGWIKSNWQILALLAGPVGLAVVTVVAHFDTIKAKVLGALNAALGFIKAFGPKALAFLSSAWKSKAAQVLTWPIRTYIKFQLKLYSAIRSVVEKAIGFVKSVWPSVANFLKDPIGNSITFIRNTIGKIPGFLQSIPGRIKSAAAGMFNGIKDAFRGAVNWIIDAWNGLEFRIPGFDPPGPGPEFGGFTLGMPDIPRLAMGGNIVAPGVVEVGDKGPELLQLPRAARVTPLDPAPINLQRALGGRRHPIRVPVYLRDKQIAEATAEISEDEAAYGA